WCIARRRQRVLVRAPAGRAAPDGDPQVHAPVDRGDVVREAAYRRVDEHRRGVRVVDDVGDLVGREVGVDGGVVETGKLATPGDFEELRPVGQDQRDTVA